MFQEPPLPPIPPRRPRTMGGTYGLASAPPPRPIYSPFMPRTSNELTLRTPRPRYGLSSSSRPFAIPAIPVPYGLAPPTTTRPLPSSSTPPQLSESVPQPTSPPIQMRIPTPTPQIMEETSPSLNERMTTPSTPMEGITSDQNSVPSTESSSAPIVLRPGSSDGSTSSSEAPSTPQMSEFQWASTSPSPTPSHFHNAEETPPWRPEYSPTGTEQRERPLPGIEYQMLDPEPRPNNTSWLTTYSHWPSQRETVQTWMAPPDFDNFNQDEETFGGYTTDIYEGYRGFTPAPQPPFYISLFPLPDSPNWETRHPTPYQTHPHRIQGYRPPQYRKRPFAGQDPPDPDDNERAGGSNNPPDPREEERHKAAEIAGQKLREIAELEKKLNDAEMEHRDHATRWGLPLCPSDKGKEPDRGRQPAQLPLPPNQY
ncbi:uncharacterized protein ARMOST_20010 [Armillaria ostoyae]|uniref:Uncharacterized protein n=1 Tax=Armillaria ostoyae TaxID=47428 RepID=A0A284S642_ARMOS|nr:uncharacterized protein ARMOST_20010 [Armillaria ostoyae]